MTAVNNENSISTTLSIIHEKACNIELTSNKNTIVSTIEETIVKLVRTEKENIKSTITIRKSLSEKLTHEDIIEQIESEWIDNLKQMPPSFWQDKDSTFCQFMTSSDKNKFLAHIKQSNNKNLVNKIVNINGEQQYEKKPARLEIQNVKGNIGVKHLEEIIKTGLSEEAQVFDFKEGKMGAQSRFKTVSFKANGMAIVQIMDKFNWMIPYVNRTTNIRTRLYIKVNAKPWICKDCYAIGQHKCEGKKCGKCGDKEHHTNQCTSATKFCTNCKKRGHKAKEAHCPIYLNTLAKNLLKMDIPVCLLESKRMRQNIIQNLAIKN